ncbi:helix-turn-helix domain-containing protein [Alkalilimnicola sp. S0819]|uniref:helix-turn-helix domain-containing protein n=1 Tax=Alkalilimnicola sp. S0819 TaxID=2613922 RepID=UPI0012622288|nr:helix-turn-helix domain-containing protein [Alkalilimnicola sp. S0819]KAB7624357.1 hypothetical protein F3N43_05995 [Alkalilimnicola sp. S0819]MPQ16183.1 hypothetical protein [Alkalilimnicola sp. S0819]
MSKLDTKTRKLLTDPIQRRAWVKYQIHLQGRSMAQVAADAGVKRQCLYSTFLKSYPRMEKVIADAVGLTPAELWPERYDAVGLPCYRTGGSRKKPVTKQAKNNTGSTPRNVRKGRAA